MGTLPDWVATFKSNPDLDEMSDATFQEFIQAKNILQSVKNELLNIEKGKRNNLYNERVEWIDLSKAENAQGVLNNYLLEHRILMSDELAGAFQEVSKQLAIVNVTYRLYKESKLSNPSSESAPNLFRQSAERFAQIASNMGADWLTNTEASGL